MNPEKPTDQSDFRKSLIEERDAIIGMEMPKFGMGVAEESVSRYNEFLGEILPIFSKYRCLPSIKVRLDSTSQQREDGSIVPVLVCGGVVCDLSFRIMPVDSEGKDGHFSDIQRDRLMEIESLLKENEE